MNKIDADQILQEAMTIVEQQGEQALAMRSLAKRLDVTPMALYRYFVDRDALLVAIVAKVSEEITIPEPAGSPADRSVDLALHLHHFLLLHPWMIRLIANGRLASPAGLQFPEGFLGCAADAGLDDEAAFVFYRTMFAAILGQAMISQAKAIRGSGSFPQHAVAEAPAKVAALAPRWQDLDHAAGPKQIFRSIARALDSE